jgi:isopentenyldiphosphate isomerase
MTKNIIVNENDEIIGYKQRSEIKQDDIYRVSALWVKNSQGDILLAKRSMTKKNSPGKWGPAVAGTVEEGETYESNIIKEAEEEIGLILKDFKKLDKIRRTGEHNYFGQWFEAVIDKKIDEFKIQEDEVEQIKWFSKNELKNEAKNNPESLLSMVVKFASDL